MVAARANAVNAVNTGETTMSKAKKSRESVEQKLARWANEKVQVRVVDLGGVEASLNTVRRFTELSLKLLKELRPVPPRRGRALRPVGRS